MNINKEVQNFHVIRKGFYRRCLFSSDNDLLCKLKSELILLIPFLNWEGNMQNDKYTMDNTL